MKQRTRAGLVFVWLLALAAIGDVQGLQQTSGDPIRLTLVDTDGPPQSEVMVEVVLSDRLPAPVRSLALSVAFPKELLLYSRADLVGRLKDQAELAAEVVDHEHDPDQTVLHLTLTASDAQGAVELDEGLLAEVTFVIYEAAEPGSDLTLESTVGEILMADGEDSPVVVTAENGTISVIESLIFSCFFYMH